MAVRVTVRRWGWVVSSTVTRLPPAASGVMVMSSGMEDTKISPSWAKWLPRVPGHPGGRLLGPVVRAEPEPDGCPVLLERRVELGDPQGAAIPAGGDGAGLDGEGRGHVLWAAGGGSPAQDPSSVRSGELDGPGAGVEADVEPAAVVDPVVKAAQRRQDVG